MTTSIQQITKLTYQSAQKVIAKMTVEEAQVLFDELNEHLTSFYGTANQYKEDKKKYAKFGPDDEHYIVVKASTVTPKDFVALMGGIKKLEVLYSYFYDKINGTKFSTVR